MNKTKKQLRAEAVERLESHRPQIDNGLLESLIGDCFYESWRDNRDFIIDLLTDDEPPYDGLINCLWNDYGIKASWDGLRKFWNVEWHANLDCPSDPGEASMMSVNAFISEHSDESCRQYADQRERGESSECESDTREKLEEDLKTTFGDGLVRSIIMRLLDRQAAITKRQCCDEQLDRERKDWKRWCEDAERKSAELQARLKNMTYEHDYWKLYADCWYDKYSELLDVNEELEGRVKQQSELIEKLASERDKLIVECEKYRDRLGKALDFAHEIGRLAD